jgi:hypothetical protein
MSSVSLATSPEAGRRSFRGEAEHDGDVLHRLAAARLGVPRPAPPRASSNAQILGCGVIVPWLAAGRSRRNSGAAMAGAAQVWSEDPLDMWKLMTKNSLKRRLERLEGLWRKQAAPIAAALAPGALPNATRAHLESAGFRPTEELLEWYGWHDGVVGGSPYGATLINTGLELHSCREAVSRYGFLREIAQQVSPSLEKSDIVWPRGWLPLMWLEGDHLAIDLDERSRDRGRIFLQGREEPALDLASSAESLTAFVQRLISVLENRLTSWDPPERRWVRVSHMRPDGTMLW